ncbi:MAG: alpha/beta hydrolase [Calditrichaeota bacterium]|nr:alpha/beta hydrolase [Calditrichota bacterium]
MKKKVSFVVWMAVILVTAGWLYPGTTVLQQPEESGERKTITFPSSDSLEITADVVITHELTVPFIVLFHQAGWSRGEYNEIIPKLNAMGFNCMAVDQRSGDAVNDVTNETHKRARSAGKKTTYLDAYQDMEAAVKFAREQYAKSKLVVWGSSYSAALVLKLAGDHTDEIDGVLSFSPGEYFDRFGAGTTYVTDAAKKITCPVFITSAKDEKGRWSGIFAAIPSKNKQSFSPESDGNHGSRALWEKFSDSKEYWAAVTAFLQKNFLQQSADK